MKENLLNSFNTVKRQWLQLRVIDLGPTISIDCRSRGLEDALRLLPAGRKKQGFHRAHVLQFSVTPLASCKEIETLCL